MRVVLVDYGAGNLHSVANALAEVGVDASLARRPEDLVGATHLVLPGVGSFGDCMAQLDVCGLTGSIREWVLEGRPFLGICLGYQMLFEGSEESPGVAGLGVVKGMVRRFVPEPGLKIPQMGWNAVVPRRPDVGRWAGLGKAPYFYYVHSYYPVPEDDGVVAAETTYGATTFAAAIETPSLLACQFHPEKSQLHGLRLIRNFFAAGEAVGNSSG